MNVRSRNAGSGHRSPATVCARGSLAAALLGLTLVVIPLLACGPFFPNSLLMSGDDAALQAPTVSFVRELERLRLEPPPRLVPAVRPGGDREATTDAEVHDLRRALAGRKLATNEVAEVVRAFSRCRADLEDHRRAMEAWSVRGADLRGEAASEDSPDPASTPRRPPRPTWQKAELPVGLPSEFALYFRGAEAWHDGRTNEARQAWRSLLALPARERSFKSTWAAYMLGRGWHQEDPIQATGYYEQTRTLTRSGLPDSAGLAIASLGWQGQLRLRTNDLAGALRLYLDQFAAGASNAALSLEVAARRVVEADPETRVAVAGDPLFRRVITAWVLSNHGWSAGWREDLDAGSVLAGDAGSPQSPDLRWLETVEATGAAEVPLAEQLAVLAYQLGDWAAAQRWVDLSGDSPVGSWIHAKLLLRAGRVEAAAEELTRAVEHLPLDPPPPRRGEAPVFADSLFDPADTVPARQEALGELGVLRLTRGEFVQSLDALLRGGFWVDAAYVAERVLTIEELYRYVDTHWADAPRPVRQSEAATAAAAVAGRTTPPGEEDLTEVAMTPAKRLEEQRGRIRHLLGRRLTRLGRGGEATPYFPESLRPAQARFLELVKAGADVAGDRRARARAWFQAGGLARTNGLEILGTEVAPDFAVWDGQFEQGPTHEERVHDARAQRLRPTAAELQRAEAHRPASTERFHYRYLAARLAWEAARLLPNNDPETADILYTGGGWLKARDPKTADLFYKALVRRCGQTELGAAADLQRWFPELDATGKPMVTRKLASPPPAAETEALPNP